MEQNGLEERRIRLPGSPPSPITILETSQSFLGYPEGLMMLEFQSFLVCRDAHSALFMVLHHCWKNPPQLTEGQNAAI